MIRRHSGPTLRARLLECLRRASDPLDTGTLARLCGRSGPYRTAATRAALLWLEARGAVVRHSPVARGRGAPQLRWTLASGCARPGVCQDEGSESRRAA